MTSVSFLFIVISLLTLMGLSMQPKEPLSWQYSNTNPTLKSVSHFRPTTSQQGSGERLKQISITGFVIALNSGIVLTDGPCRQLMVVQVTRQDKRKSKNPYVLVQRDYGCDAKPFPIGMFQSKRKWEFTLIRDSSCDHTFEEIDDIVGISPAGGSYRIPTMKMVPGNEGNKMPTTEKMACYRLTGELKPTGRSSLVRSSRRKQLRPGHP